MVKKKNLLISILSFVLTVSCLSSFVLGSGKSASADSGILSAITKITTPIQNDISKHFDESVVTALPSSVKDDQDVSVIVAMKTANVVQSYNNTDKKLEIEDYVATRQAKKIVEAADVERDRLIAKLDGSGISYTLGQTYDNVVSGFEVVVKAKDFSRVEDLLNANEATAIVGEVYEPAEYKVVENKVEVEDTGIFTNTVKDKYDGSGVVVAILDTGLDYTHSAFASGMDTTADDVINMSVLRSKLNKLEAAKSYNGLTAEDLFVSRKVPYAFDYADKDPDVLPINSEHGTHVAGIIAGEDDVIEGVATGAQLAIMKVFSDAQDGAKTSWLLAALEDCVNLGVDVINMSLGSGCGFSREVDEKNVADIYDSVKEAGISLIASAANSYNATMGSEKNGNNGLTSNPDSGTVGSPSTYDAALSIASVDGVMTPYILYNDQIMYFKEASTADNVDKDFVSEILKAKGDLDGKTYTSYDFTYVTIPGYGESSDYSTSKEDNQGKIALVKRGVTTFEQKVRIAFEKGFLGVIIYNNVSGSISMSVGNNMGAVCSLAQDEGEILAANKEGTIRLSTDQVAGPFMSDFSSWGPTSDLKIKPEITGHGGEIYSAVPGQGYEKLSGTSMAAPNLAGATALIRQYVKKELVSKTNKNEKAVAQEVTAVVNRLMMSTADIVLNKNGLPYAVRKQGAGLVSISKATKAESYLVTYDEKGEFMDKTKLEIGDDKNRAGEYTMVVGVKNVNNKSTSYDVSALVNTEGVSKTYTSHGGRTVTQDGYALEGAQKYFTVVKVEGGSHNGNKVTVDAGATAKVTVKVTLTDEDKRYLDENFENGMYIEGFVKFTATGDTKTDLSVPFLGFYGDWTQAPIFDEEYYDTNKDELNAGIDAEDKLMPDAYATRAVGRLYSDYISTLGTYYFKQNPASAAIPANKEHIAISNQVPKDNETNYTVNGIRSISAGLLRNVKKAYMTVTDNATGEVIWNKEINNQRKSFSSGASIYASSFDVDFSVLEHNLKNNTRYTFRVETYIDYNSEEEQNNVRNVFEFPFYIDFEAPVISDVTYRTDYDSVSKKTKLYADISVYDNHYAMAMQLGQIVENTDPTSTATFSLETFGEYFTPIYSSYNSASTVSVELTDYVQRIKNSAGIKYDKDGKSTIIHNSNTYIVNVYDYAMNAATYELKLPDEVISMYFTDGKNVIDTLTLSPNQTIDLNEYLKVYPNKTVSDTETWIRALDCIVEDDSVISVVNDYLVAKSSGNAVLTVKGKDKNGTEITAKLNVKVLAPGETGYIDYTVQQVNKFSVTGYETLKAYYSLDSEDREIGFTGSVNEFGKTVKLSMYPSESVKLNYVLDSYFPDRTTVAFEAGNKRVTVDEKGVIVAQTKGNSSVTVTVRYTDPKTGKTTNTNYSTRISITVKEPFKTQSIYLMSYKGLGGTVTIPANKGITTIYQYAFSNYEYIEKDLDNGDVIDKEDPYYIKPAAIGENTIERVEIPEGVKEIQQYAFAKLTALKSVKLPSTLTKIGVGAFEGCTSLTSVEGLENVQFVNKDSFKNCTSLSTVNLGKVVAIGNYAFENSSLGSLSLPETAQSIGIGSFKNNKELTYVTFNASKIKVGSYAFEGCSALRKIDINAAVLSSYAFRNCSTLSDVTLGKDVQVIGEYAFADTSVQSFKLSSQNTYFISEESGAALVRKEDGVKTLVLVAPASKTILTTDAQIIAKGAFSGNTRVARITANNATTIEEYAFAGCKTLTSVKMPKVKEIGAYAFYGTNIPSTPDLTNVTKIGKYAFAGSSIKSVVIPDNVTIDEYAFAFANSLRTATIGKNVKIGDYAFANRVDLTNTFEHAINKIPYTERTNSRIMAIFTNYYTLYTYDVKDKDGNIIESHNYFKYDLTKGNSAPSTLASLTIGEGSAVGDYAFYGNVRLSELTLGSGVSIGDYAFYDAASLTNADLSGVKSIGDFAFSGDRTREYLYENGTLGYAYDFKTSDGNDYTGDDVIATGYKYTGFAPAFKNADISAANKVGQAAFAGNDTLEVVKLSDSVKKISDYLFAYCTSLKSVECANDLTYVGAYAFYGSGIKEIDTSGILEFGEFALARTAVSSVTFADGATVGDYAFAYCNYLTTAENLGKVAYIGDGAFISSLIEKADLTSATYVGDYAFASSAVKKVTFGNALTDIGENPFADCDIETFARNVKESFGSGTIDKVETTYDIGDGVKVENDVIYKTVNKGLVLVTYPKLKSVDDYVVLEGTVRISARAFYNASLKSVTIASTVTNIGDKAFFGCNKLSVVTFLSLEAPLLEEEYDTSYLTYDNMPMNGNLSTYTGLGITKFNMWNVTSRYNNFYFGANFVNHIGHIERSLVMIRPANGENYNSFIYGKYFDTVIDGQNAASSVTKNVIEMINALNKTITLDDEAAVVAARNAYNSLPSVQQQALVSNYRVLTEAESVIEFLKLKDSSSDSSSSSSANEQAGVGMVALFIAIGVLIVAGIAAAVVIILRKKRKQ